MLRAKVSPDCFLSSRYAVGSLDNVVEPTDGYPPAARAPQEQLGIASVKTLPGTAPRRQSSLSPTAGPDLASVELTSAVPMCILS